MDRVRKVAIVVMGLTASFGAVRIVAAEVADVANVNTIVPAVMGSFAPATVEVASEGLGRSWFGEAKDLYEDRRFAAAAAAYVQAAKAGYREETAWYNAACSYALVGQKARAIAALQEAVDSGFDSVRLLNGDSDLDALRSDAGFRRIVAEFRESPAGRGEQREAEREWERAQQSRDPDRWGDAGIALLRSGDAERAVEAFSGQIRLKKSATATYNLACAQAMAGHDEALATLEQAILTGYGDGDKVRVDSDLASLRDAPGFTRLARLADDLTLFTNERHDRDGGRARWRADLGHFEEVVSRHKTVGRAWFNLGFARLRAGDGRGGVTAFEKALALDYRPPTTLYNLACAAAQIPDRDAAIAWLEKSAAAGMELRHHAMHDRDLSPLMSDPRFKAMRSKWRRENAENWFGGKRRGGVPGEDRDPEHDAEHDAGHDSR